jgi:NAD(P)H dehydrogenase (quinone)
MTTVAVVYHSGTGHTQKMAEAVAEGAGSVAGVRANLIAIDGKDITNGRWQNDDVLGQLDASDAIIFGSPTYMGGVSGQMECFLDATAERWMKQSWRDKIASGFSVSGGPSGDKFNTLVRFATLAMQQGMIWVGLGIIPNSEGLNRLSFYFGAGGQAMQEPPEEAPNAEDKKTGAALGQRVAEVAIRLSAT